MMLHRNIGGRVLILFLVLGFITVAIVGGLISLGKSKQNLIAEYLQKGAKAIEDDNPTDGLDAFYKAKTECNNIVHAAFRLFGKITGKEFSSPEQIDQMIIAAILMKAYDSFFELKPEPELIAQGEKLLENMKGTEAEELRILMKTAGRVSELCQLFQEKKYTEVMEKLLEAEKSAEKSDQDFFIMEIRLLIACGRAMKDQAILGQARELLWFISSELEVNSPKIPLLWSLLNESSSEK